MKTILRLICILTMAGTFAASAQEASPDAKEAAKATIAKAKDAIAKVTKSHDEFLSLSKQQADGTIPMAKKEKERLTQIRSDRSASLELNRQVAALLKVGDSIFSYPGLLALSEVAFDEQSNRYSLRLVIDFKRYEDGVEKHPTYRIVEFDEAGRITEIKEFATVKMVTE